MMFIALTTLFIVGYFLIATETWHKMDKMISALMMMVISWAFIFMGMQYISVWLDPAFAELTLSKLGQVPDFVGSAEDKTEQIHRSLTFHLGKTAEILIFLIGAMTIVELIDHFKGFEVVQKLIKSKTKYGLLITLSCFAFILSAVIDNLTATLVMITVYRKFVYDSKDRIWFASFIIIAANAGGAWSPIGDVTTTILWVAKKVSPGPLFITTFIPSVLAMAIPLFIAKYLKPFKGKQSIQLEKSNEKIETAPLLIGLILLLMVPFFKAILGLPPYLGMMLSLSLYALWAEIKSLRTLQLTTMGDETKLMASSPTLKSLQKVEMPTILFFLGILLTVAALESMGIIFGIGQSIQNSQVSNFLFISGLGVLSAVVDNVPLVAGSLGLFPYPTDHISWHLLAYAAGTGGSMLVIGSAAGVVAMGMEKISFTWYLKNIAWVAFLGYVAGLLFFLLLM